MQDTAQQNNSENQTPPSVTAKLYDADAEQRVELILKRTNGQGKTVRSKVKHIFRPMTDEEFFQYESKKSIVQKISGTNVLEVRTEDKNLEAAQWLWDLLAIGRENYKPRDDWREATNLLDKKEAIEKGLLAVFVAQEDDEEIFVENFDDELFDDEFDDEQPTIVALDFLFDETPLTGVHHFRQPSAKDVGDYERTMKKATNRINARNGFRQKKSDQTAQIAIPSKARELCALYDRLIERTEGYVGRVPAHHKREAVLELFSRESEVTEKNF